MCFEDMEDPRCHVNGYKAFYKLISNWTIKRRINERFKFRQTKRLFINNLLNCFALIDI